MNPIERVQSFYQQYASRYDRETSFYDRFLLGDGRAWVCSRASGAVLEVAIGTGRNLPFYPQGIQLTGIDLTPAMLAIAHDRARQLGMPVTLVQGDAQALPFPDNNFDTWCARWGSTPYPTTRQRSRRCTGPTAGWRTAAPRPRRRLLPHRTRAAAATGEQVGANRR